MITTISQRKLIFYVSKGQIISKGIFPKNERSHLSNVLFTLNQTTLVSVFMNIAIKNTFYFKAFGMIICAL